MQDYGKLTRDQILTDIDLLQENAEFLSWRDTYLEQAVFSLDLALARAMLAIGANPDLKNGADSFLHHLVQELASTRSTQGESIIAMAEVLLAHGADPNFVGCNNYRAVDLAMIAGCSKFVRLLLSAGADPTPRPFI